MSDRKRQVKRVRHEQVIKATIVLTIDAKIENGKLLIGVQTDPVVVSDPISVKEEATCNPVH